MLQFTAVRPDEQDIDIFVSATALGARTPGVQNLRVNVVANAVFLELNSQVGEETTAQEVIDAINSRPSTNRLIIASINDGMASAKVGNRTINYSPLQLTGVGSSYDTATSLSDDTDLGATLVITGSGTSFEDGAFFTITDKMGQARKFEFDSDEPPGVNDAAAIRIPFSSALSHDKMTNAVANAINSASFGATAFVAGNQVRLEGESFVNLGAGVPGLQEQFQRKFDGGNAVEVVLGGNAFRGDVGAADTFSIVDAAGTSHLFEFDSGFFLTVPQSGADIGNGEQFTIRFNDPTTPVEVVFEFEDSANPDGLVGGAGTVQIDFTVADSQATLATAIVAAIQGKLDDGTLSGIQPLDLGNGQIHLGGSVLHEVFTRFVYNVPLDGMAISDGDTFEIRFDNQVAPASVVRFEFDDVAVNNGVSSGNIEIAFAQGDTQASLTSAIAAVIQSKIDDGTLPGVLLITVTGRIEVRGTSYHSVVQSGPVGVGLTGVPGAQIPGAIAIPLVPDVSFTATDLARVIAQSVNQSLFAVGVTATARGNQISFDGERSIEGLGPLAGLRESIQAKFDVGPVIVVKTANTSMLPDGSTIVIRDDRGTIHRFEIDRDATANLNDPTATRIFLNGT
ncbi:MAG: hypothetical protein HYV60_12040, partial [Planctomycetia bacterium]|nr:hypothetical protein [Planctomycetia bacterium]